MYTAEQNVHLQDFCKVCLVGKYYHKFCLKKNCYIKNSGKLLNKFNDGQKCLFLTEEKVDDTGTQKQTPENLCACWLFKAYCQNPQKNF